MTLMPCEAGWCDEKKLYETDAARLIKAYEVKVKNPLPPSLVVVGRWHMAPYTKGKKGFARRITYHYDPGSEIIAPRIRTYGVKEVMEDLPKGDIGILPMDWRVGRDLKKHSLSMEGRAALLYDHLEDFESKSR